MNLCESHGSVPLGGCILVSVGLEDGRKYVYARVWGLGPYMGCDMVMSECDVCM